MKLFALIISVVVFSQSVFAFTFRNLRNDIYIPDHCKQTNIQHFNMSQFETFTVSIAGSRSNGFTFEYPISRSNAHKIYRAFYDGHAWNPNYQQEISRDPELYRDFLIVMSEHQNRGFDLGSEGEVLELLVINAMQYTLNQLGILAFVSGSVDYWGPSRGGSRGELDIIIADFHSCRVFAYGEVKLGPHRIGKAREQIMRFSNNLRTYGLNHQLNNPSIPYLQ